MNLMRFDPYREIASMQDRLSRVFGRPNGATKASPPGRPRSTSPRRRIGS